MKMARKRKVPFTFQLSSAAAAVFIFMFCFALLLENCSAFSQVVRSAFLEKKPHSYRRSLDMVGAPYDCYDMIKTVSVLSAETDNYVPIQRIWTPKSSRTTVLCFLTHLGDISSFEFAQTLLYYLPDFEDEKVEVFAVGIGTIEGGREFSEATGFPLDRLFLDQEGKLYELLNFSKGFETNMPINPYLKLVPMLTGGKTLQEVFRGYIGDRGRSSAWLRSALKLVEPGEFDRFAGREGTAGEGSREGQRPLELATLRLQNSMKIIEKWDVLSPINKELITQQGGTLIFKGKKVVYRYNDLGILRYTPIEQVFQVTGVRPATRTRLSPEAVVGTQGGAVAADEAEQQAGVGAEGGGGGASAAAAAEGAATAAAAQ